MIVVDFSDLATEQLWRAAQILRESIRGPSYESPGEAEAEVASFLESPDRFGLAALVGESLVGWVGGVRGYSHALELHPLVVDEAWRQRGVGRRLVSAIEAAAAAAGYLVVHLGTDDEFGGTSLFGDDLLPGALDKLAAIRPTSAGHPYFFYRRLGYEAVGVLPDANGAGKPDILMAKRVARSAEP